MSSTTPATIARTFQEDGFLRAIMDTIVDAIITINSQGRIQHANPATERMFGYSLAELAGQNISLLMPPPYRDEHDGYLARYLSGGPARIIGIGRQVLGRRKDGAIFPMDLAVSETTVDGVRYFTGVIRDITERVHAEEQLRKERDFSRNLIDTAHAVILLLDPLARIERFNPYLEQLSGYSLDEVAGRDWFATFIPQADREPLQESFHRMLTGQPVINLIHPLVTRTGQPRLITWSGRRLLNHEGEVIGILMVGNDVTELKDAERRLVQSERLAAVGQMVTGLAHESRNALQRSQASLEMLEMDLEHQPEQLVLIHRAQKALQELRRLYEEVREYAAPLKLERREVQLPVLLEECWQQVRQATSGIDVNLDLCCSGPEPRLLADPHRLQQVFRNILENALAVSPPGGTITTHCRETLLRGRPAWALEFVDQGPGLSEEQQRRIFDPFFTTKSRGTGLGMAISQRIVEAHGGTILAENAPRAGACITVILPET